MPKFKYVVEVEAENQEEADYAIARIAVKTPKMSPLPQRYDEKPPKVMRGPMAGLREQIEDMPPETFAKAAQAAAQLTVKMLEKAGKDVDPKVKWMAESSIEEIVEAKRKADEQGSKMLDGIDLAGDG